MGGLFGKLFGKVLIGVITLYRLFVSHYWAQIAGFSQVVLPMASRRLHDMAR